MPGHVSPLGCKHELCLIKNSGFSVDDLRKQRRYNKLSVKISDTELLVFFCAGTALLQKMMNPLQFRARFFHEHEWIGVRHSHAAIQRIDTNRQLHPILQQSACFDTRNGLDHRRFDERGMPRAELKSVRGFKGVDHVQVMRPALGPIFPGMH